MEAESITYTLEPRNLLQLVRDIQEMQRRLENGWTIADVHVTIVKKGRER